MNAAFDDLTDGNASFLLGVKALPAVLAAHYGW
jgi:hypothetical protein